MVIVHSSAFYHKVLHHIHASPEASHMRYCKILKKANLDFTWPGMRKDIKNLVRECHVCQANKLENVMSPGLL